VKTPFPEKMSEAESLRAFADECVKSPAMYLMALRAHLQQGSNAIGELFRSVADPLPATLPIKNQERR
jgi:hypothetical protein